MPMRELFVYYRVNPLDGGAALGVVRAMHAALRADHPGLEARLLRRPDEADGKQTWMETYTMAAVPGGVSDVVQAEIELAAKSLAQWTAGPRHVEVFEPI